MILCYSVGGGTTWHAVGLINPLKGGTNDIKLSQYAIDLFPELEKETDASTGMTAIKNRICMYVTYNIHLQIFVRQLLQYSVVSIDYYRLEKQRCHDGC